jgi:hypothetical protein
LQTSNLILDFEFDQHLESHKHVISIIMGFRDTGCYMQVFLLLPIFLHKLPYQENRIHSRSLWHKTKLVFGDVANSP